MHRKRLAQCLGTRCAERTPEVRRTQFFSPDENHRNDDKQEFQDELSCLQNPPPLPKEPPSNVNLADRGFPERLMPALYVCFGVDVSLVCGRLPKERRDLCFYSKRLAHEYLQADLDSDHCNICLVK